MNVLLLTISVFLGAGRSIFSKKMSTSSVRARSLYINQSILFLSAAIAIFVFDIHAFCGITRLTLLYGICFGIATFLAQWCYTMALGKGPTSICAMVYSFGFIFPTVSGAIFWDEPFGITSAIGLLIAISAIVASAFSGGNRANLGSSFIVPNIIAMLSSGALGIMQKMHQLSVDREHLQGFLVIAFLLAAIIAFGFALTKDEDKEERKRKNLYPILAGGCFGLVSMLNTLLAGRMPSAIIFPTLNIGVMIMCLIAGVLLFREKPTKPQIVAFSLGILAIIVLSFK